MRALVVLLGCLGLLGALLWRDRPPLAHATPPVSISDAPHTRDPSVEPIRETRREILSSQTPERLQTTRAGSALGEIGYADGQPPAGPTAPRSGGDYEYWEDLIAQALDAGDRAVVEKLRAALDGMDSEELAQYLLDELSSGDEARAVQAALAMSALTEPVRASAFIEVLRTSTTYLVQLDVARQIASWSTPELNAQLAALGFDAALSVDHRGAILAALMDPGPSEVVDRLFDRAFHSPATNDRLALLRAADQSGSQTIRARSVPLIEAVLASNNPAEWGAAVDLLKHPECCSARSARALEQLLAGGLPRVQQLRFERALAGVRTALEAQGLSSE